MKDTMWKLVWSSNRCWIGFKSILKNEHFHIMGHIVGEECERISHLCETFTRIMNFQNRVLIKNYFRLSNFSIFWFQKFIFSLYGTLTIKPGSPRYSVLRGRFFNLNKNWLNYGDFKFLSYELHFYYDYAHANESGQL